MAITPEDKIVRGGDLSKIGELVKDALDSKATIESISYTPSSADGGNNVLSIALTNGETVTAQIKNGNQGNSGYSGAAGELEVVNNLTDGGAEKALSAQQGVELNTKLFSINIVECDLSSLERHRAIISSSDKWAVYTTDQYFSVLIPVTSGDMFLIDATNGAASYVWLTDDTITSSATPDFCTGYSSRISVESGTSVVVAAPNDAAFMYWNLVTGGTTRGCKLFSSGPSSLSQRLNEIEDVVPSDASAENKLVDKAYVDDHYAILDTEMFNISASKIDLSSLEKHKAVITSSNKWAVYTSNQYFSVLVPVTPRKSYMIDAVGNAASYAWLQNDTITHNTVPSFCSGYNSRIAVDSGTSIRVVAPNDASYMYWNLVTSGTTRDCDLYESANIPERLSEIEEMISSTESVTRDKFETAPEYYAWLVAEQYTKLKWTPLKAVPKASLTTDFEAGVEVTGIPYSSVAEYDKRVPHDVSIHTFMTCVHNPYSLMYTENTKYAYSSSAYGRTYYGPANAGPYMGMVCSGYTAAALGMPLPFVTAVFADLAEQGLFEVVYDQSANGLKRCDVLWRSGHVMFVKDVWRKNGLVTEVLVGQEAQPYANDMAKMTAAQFNTWMANNGVIIYRYTELYKNIHYQPSPYVAVGEETAVPVTYNDDICTFAGDRATFAEGDLIYVHCLNLSYTQMELYKDDVLIDTITLANDSRASLTSDNLAYAVNLSGDDLGYGKYKARLTDGNDYSDYTYWEILDTNLSVSGDTATYSSANAEAVFFAWQRYHSSSGSGMFNMTALSGNSGTFDCSRRQEGYNLLKVSFQGDYGRATAVFLES